MRTSRWSSAFEEVGEQHDDGPARCVHQVLGVVDGPGDVGAAAELHDHEQFDGVGDAAREVDGCAVDGDQVCFGVRRSARPG